MSRRGAHCYVRLYTVASTKKEFPYLNAAIAQDPVSDSGFQKNIPIFRTDALSGLILTPKEQTSTSSSRNAQTDPKSTTGEPQLKISFLFISMPTTAVFNVILTLKFTIMSTAVAGTKVAWFTVPGYPGSRQWRPCGVLLGTLRTVATCQTDCFME